MRARSEERTTLQLAWGGRGTRSEAGTESESAGRASAAIDTRIEVFEARRALRDVQTRQQCARCDAIARLRIRISTVNVTMAGRGQVPMRLGVAAGLQTR